MHVHARTTSAMIRMHAAAAAAAGCACRPVEACKPPRAIGSYHDGLGRETSMHHVCSCMEKCKGVTQCDQPHLDVQDAQLGIAATAATTAGCTAPATARPLQEVKGGAADGCSMRAEGGVCALTV